MESSALAGFIEDEDTLVTILYRVQDLKKEMKGSRYPWCGLFDHKP